ncbi:hypothetical protein LPJ63_003736 [Coemansia sp. RSA 2711]|nr:hypothetical protein LPJ63_003736 [Coemansia sp. RSA 2711]KAJ1841792.1 hypothetical protein LPJ70_004086 [Coemansia sp. RSA 2708]KAJ2352936.1 hypothetical protein H4S02_013374 [Coemansia sp. RSA 2611]KAJ2355188.1 hypothetical protein H4S01_006953 [Coemansia sp. RSA 2610]
MDVEMDLIRQRAPNDSGHGSTAILPAIQRPLQSADSAAGDGLHQGASTDSGMQLPPLAEIGAGMSSARTTVRNDARRASDFAHDPKEMTLGQNAASSSSIMSFSAGDNNPVQEADDTALCIVRNLIGSSVTAGQKLQNIDGLQGIFFVFPDLSIRKDGEYRLRFSFFNLQGEDGELMTSVTQIKAHTFSEPFRVYSAKQFPGMIESTVLSKHFAKQGVKIPVRKESGKGGEFET